MKLLLSIVAVIVAFTSVAKADCFSDYLDAQTHEKAAAHAGKYYKALLYAKDEIEAASLCDDSPSITGIHHDEFTYMLGVAHLTLALAADLSDTWDKEEGASHTSEAIHILASIVHDTRIDKSVRATAAVSLAQGKRIASIHKVKY